MREKDGAIIVGLVHSGKENADRVIQALVENGLKKGQLVAVEDRPYGLKKFRENFEKGLFPHYIRVFSRDLQKTEDKIKSCSDKKELKELKHLRGVYSNIVGELSFNLKLYGFLFSKKVKLLPMSSHAMDETARFMKTGSRQRKRIRKFIALPIREGHWRKQLLGKNPDFVLVGSGHLASLRRTVPYSKAVNLDKSFPLKKALERARDELTRARYRAIKGIKAKKRKRRKIKVP